MPDPYGGYFGNDEDPMNYPGGATAASAFARMAPDRAGTQWAPWEGGPRDSAGATGGRDEINRSLWDLLLGRGGTEYQGPQGPGWAPPAMSSRQPRDSAGVTGGAGDRHRSFWDRVFGREGTEYQGPQEAYGPPGTAPPAGPMPGGGAPLSASAPPPTSKPVTKITSGENLADIVRRLIDPEWSTSNVPTLGMPPNWEGLEVPPNFLPPYQLPPSYQVPPSEPPMRERGAPPSQNFLSSMLPGSSIGRNIFGPPRTERAEGGAVPGFMRGGYPELYDKPIRQGYFATGGASNYVPPDGRGDGRSDHIEARLSPGEFVVDSETLALLGDGDGEAGARKMDQMRANIRKQKGEALAQGKISPKAKKHAEEYMSKSLSRSALKNVGR